MRLTVDVDGKRKLKKTLQIFNDVFGNGVIDEIYLSASKKGYHVICYGLNISTDQMFLYRELLKDDKFRIMIDKYKHKVSKSGLQVLWTLKKGKRVKKIYDRLLNYNILPKSLRCYV